MAVATIRSAPALEVANCLAADAVGDLVYCTGEPVSGIRQVSKADPNTPGQHPAFAVIVEKYSDTKCAIQGHGITPDIYSGLTPGSLYWLGADGRPAQVSVTAAPQAIGTAVSSQAISLAFDEDVKPTTGGPAPLWKEDEFNPTNGQITFILSQAPTDPNSIVFIANGVAADDGDDYTINGQTITWTDNWFVMDTSDKVLVRYL